MGSELGGRWGDAARSYATAYQLSRARDYCGKVLEALRP